MDISKGVSKYVPGMLTGFGILSFLASSVSAALATPAAMERILDAEEEKGEYLTPLETLKAVWKPYKTSIVLAAAGTTCCITSTAIQYKATALAIAAGTVAEHAYLDTKRMLDDQIEKNDIYRQKVQEELGDEKEREIYKRATEEVQTVQTTPYVLVPPEALSYSGDILCMDGFTGQPFYGNPTDIREIVNELNARLNRGEDITLNDWLSAINCQERAVGEYLIWESAYNGCISDRLIEVYFDSEIIKDIQYMVVYFVPGHGPIGRVKS